VADPKDVAQQVADAQAEIASWSPEKREAVQLEGYMEPTLNDDALPKINLTSPSGRK